MPRAPRNVPRTPPACSNARPPRCLHASLLLLLRSRIPPPLLAPSSSPRHWEWETEVMVPRWKSSDGRHRLLLLLWCCLLAFPCHAQVTTNVSHRSDQGIHSFVGTYGINYGRIADNLPPPEDVVRLLKLARIRNVKIYDADHKVLDAFRGSGLNLVVAIPNEFLKDMAANPSKAMDWLNENVQPYYPSTRIVGITVGNEVLGGGDVGLAEALVGAVVNVHDALRMLRLDSKIELSTPHSEAVFANSYPPSSCVFRDDLMVYLRPLLDFFSKTGAPFYVNAYPFLAYMSDPSHIDINYALFKPNSGIVDPKTNLHYSNMFEAQLDAAYFALEAAGYPGMEARVAETGWASAGDATEAGASMENAVTYNRNLRKRLFLRKGTPYRPDRVAKAYIFALFNEDLKPGPTTERHYGLFKPDGSISINIGLKGLVPSSAPPSPSLLPFKRVRAWGWIVQYSAALLPCTLIFLALAT
ncbi:Glucan endo-1,3-beta-glucosidase 14 [Dichanthelium oligosanthes]|uniref:glucan endo-1,3-beta-D-glucosidase n=1 Tax=Dichanthelium oligosanthes TaxID=888268 RepID=A0A1E5VYQ6_9POAL|nr:Glucan endo-1,3-beta-glucosidase 14 [Dichanthelium oligosanthes]